MYCKVTISRLVYYSIFEHFLGATNKGLLYGRATIQFFQCRTKTSRRTAAGFGLSGFIIFCLLKNLYTYQDILHLNITYGAGQLSKNTHKIGVLFCSINDSKEDNNVHLKKGCCLVVYTDKNNLVKLAIKVT